VLDAEPVQAVLCADDTNPYTHIPLLLAKQRGLPTVSCHHGALDGRYIFKRVHADVILAKGKMEEDYLLRVCGVAKERVEIGAPASPQTAMPKTEHRRHSPKPCIVFFSESYEVSGARGKDFYLDVLPPLATLALSERRELVVKLHPAESASERRRFVTQVLSPEQQTVTRVVSGPLQADLIERAWFAVTILSTVATECAVRGIPCFLCKWLESWPYGYIDQFARFGVGLPLDGPAEILDIPSRLGNYAIDPAIRESCWQPIEPSRFEALLGFGPNRDHAHDDRNIPTGHLP